MNDSQKWLVFAGTVGFGFLLYLLGPVLTPFLVAALFAYMGDPLVDRLEAQKLSRTVSVIIVFVIIFFFVLLIPIVLIPLVEQQISILMQKLPAYLDWVQQQVFPDLAQFLGINPSDLDIKQIQKMVLQHWQDAGGVVAIILASAKQSGFVMVAFIANLVLVPVVTFYLLRDWDIVIGHVRSLIPRKLIDDITRLSKDSDEVLGAFLRGQVMVMCCLGVVYTVGLWIVGVDLSLLIGMIAGLVSFVPYLGFIVGIVLAAIAVFMQFHEFLPLLWVLLVFGVGQALEGMLLTPMLVGDKIGLHPVAVIFAVLAGGQLFGFVGILLALPVAAVIMVLLRFTHERYVSSDLYSG